MQRAQQLQKHARSPSLLYSHGPEQSITLQETTCSPVKPKAKRLTDKITMAEYEDDGPIWWHGQLEPEEMGRLAEMLCAWRDYAEHRKKTEKERMQRAREYAALEAQAAEKNERHLISWVTFRRWETFWREAKKERQLRNPHLYVPEESEETVAPQVAWEPLGPVGDFYASEPPKMPRKRPAAKPAVAAQPSIVIVKTHIKRKFKTPAGSPALRNIPAALLTGRHGMHQFVDKERLKYKNQMWRYRTNAVANRTRTQQRGNWVNMTESVMTGGSTTDGAAPPPYASVTNQSGCDGSVLSEGSGITTGASYTIQYADVPVAVNKADDPRSEDTDAPKKHTPAPPTDPKTTQALESTSTVRRMYSRKFGKQKHRLSHIDKGAPKKQGSQGGRGKLQPITSSGGNSSTGTSSLNPQQTAYNQYYSFLQNQIPQ